jgi:AcrR family transcriptional regulator
MSVKRQELVETAMRLFGEYGFHATGIDRIAEEANISKKTMYNHFRSKEELIIAALKHYDSVARNHFMKEVEKRTSNPYERLLAVFDVTRDWFCEKRFFGCMFIKVIGEFADRNEGILQVSREYKRLIAEFIEKLARDAGIADAKEVAASLALLLEGAIVIAQITGNPDSADTARAAARVIIDDALTEKS